MLRTCATNVAQMPTWRENATPRTNAIECPSKEETVAAITQGMEQLQTQPGNAPMQCQSPPGILRPNPMPSVQPVDNPGYMPAPRVQEYVRPATSEEWVNQQINELAGSPVQGN